MVNNACVWVGVVAMMAASDKWFKTHRQRFQSHGGGLCEVGTTGFIGYRRILRCPRQPTIEVQQSVRHKASHVADKVTQGSNPDA